MGTGLAPPAGVRAASDGYRPRQPDRDALRQVVCEHFETFRDRVGGRRDGQGLPRFVDRAFRDFVTCGSLAGGFARFRCAGCGFERQLAFSCKNRGFCPSCAGRRMTDRAAHLVDHVFPAVPIRQWVLTLPPRVRYLLAWDHALCRDVVAVFLRAVVGWLRRRAHGRGARGGRGGAVAIIQRFGGALNLNVHVHALVADGVFTVDDGCPRFWPGRPAAGEDIATLTAIVAQRIRALLARRGLLDDGGGVEAPDLWAEDAPVLAHLAAASVRGVAALGSRAGAPVRRWGDPIDRPDPARPGRWHARHEGFDLHAAIVVPAGARDRLERLCRYALRPPVGQDRVQRMPDGTVVLELRRRWTDGTTHLIFDPVELLERLAALVPRPRINLVLYHGVFAPRAAWRAAIVPAREPEAAANSDRASIPPDGDHGHVQTSNRSWADLMQRSFGFDVLACPRCTGRLRLVALIHNPAVVQRILRHLGLPETPPAVRPSRAPPLADDWIDDPQFCCE